MGISLSGALKSLQGMNLSVPTSGTVDPEFNNVLALVQPQPGDTSILDYSSYSRPVNNNGATIDTNEELFTGYPTINFDSSSNQRFNFPDSDDWTFPGDFTIEAWLYVPIEQDYLPIIEHHQDSGDRWIFEYNNAGGTVHGRVMAYRENNGSYNVLVSDGGLQQPPTGVWHHLAVTRSGDTFRIFSDGNVAASDTVSHTFKNYNGVLRIGMTASGGTSFWNGNMTGIRVTDSVARYTSAFTPPTEPFPTQ